MTLPLQHDKRHIRQAEHNEDLLRENCFPDPCSSANLRYGDWIITIAFYAALHYIEAYLHTSGFRATFLDHRERNDYLKNFVSVRDAKVARILQKYIGLYKLSRLVRYTPCQYYYTRVPDACNYFKFALEDLPKILNIPK
jgi:hypothetical protein